MTPTPEQQAIIDLKLGPGGVAKVTAGAGTGKTSTFVEYSRARSSIDILYLAFNKSVQEEAKTKFPKNVDPRTPHSLAFRKIGHEFLSGGRKIASNVSFRSIRTDFGVRFSYAAQIRATVENYLNSSDRDIGEEHVPLPEPVDGYPVDHESFLKNRKWIAGKAYEVWNKLVSGNNRYYPMTHSGYLKLYQLENPVLPGKVILFDEAQDTNPVTMDIVMRQVESGKRIVMCGDPFQSIYQWRGAIDAMQKVDAPELTLSHSFRFGQEIADLANRLLNTWSRTEFVLHGRPDIESRVRMDVGHLEDLCHGYTVICRTNRGVLENMLDLTDRKVTFKLNGDFNDFINFIMDGVKLKAGKRDELSTRGRLAGFRHFEDVMEVAEFDPELRAMVGIVTTLGDRVEKNLDSLQAHHETNGDLADVIITTAHKSKGLEWDNVRLYSDFPDLRNEDRSFVRFKNPDTSCPKNEKTISQEEINLLYVALTRARKELVPGVKLGQLIDPSLAPKEIQGIDEM